MAAPNTFAWEKMVKVSVLSVDGFIILVKLI